MLNRRLEFKTSGHLDPALSDPSTRVLNADKLTGRWLNTNPQTEGITEITIDRDGDQFWISASGAGDSQPIAWPRTSAQAIANLEEEGGQRAVAFTATFESFAVQEKLQRADELNRRYRIQSVPTIIVNGKYTTDGGQAGSYDDLIALIDELVATERAGR